MRESEYAKQTPIRHRKDFGQFFTPSSVARLMVQWVLKSNPATVLDPAFGLGIFYDELNKLKPCQELQFIGYEIDKHIIDYLNSDADKANLKIINHDYLEADTKSQLKFSFVSIAAKQPTPPSPLKGGFAGIPPLRGVRGVFISDLV